MYLSTISSWALLIAKALDESGYSSQDIFKRANLDPGKLKQPNARYTYEDMTKLWRIAAETTGDPCIGLRVAEFWHPTTMHALGYSWMASSSLMDALNRLIRYQRILTTVTTLHIEEDEEEVRLVIPMPTSPFPPAMEAIDGAIAVFIKMCRTSYGDEFNPLEIFLIRDEPGCAEEFNNFFRSPISYSSLENVICFSRKDLEKSLPTANAELALVNDKVVTSYLANLDKSDIKAQVEAKIIEELPSGKITEEWMASRLNKSLRSLQRKLAENGTSYKTLLDSTRQQLAKQYVANSQYSINEITYLLGFSEPSNFSRAFKRWTGQSPSQYRENLFS